MKRPDERPLGMPPSGGADALEALFQCARRDGFTPVETGELWGRLSLAVGIPVTVAPSNPPVGAPSVASSGFTAKSIAVVLLGTGAIVAAGLAGRSILERSFGYGPPAASTSSTAERAVPERNDEPSPTARSADIGLAAEAPAAAPALTAAPGSDRGRRPEQSKPHALVGRAPSASADSAEANARPSHDETMPSLDESNQAPPAPMQGSPTVAQSTAGAVESKESARPPVALDPPMNEGALLLMARRELDSYPAGALELTKQHAKLFPKGALVPEREVLAIEALVALGRGQEARTRFDAFRTRFPRSPHAARLQALFSR